MKGTNNIATRSNESESDIGHTDTSSDSSVSQAERILILNHVASTNNNGSIVSNARMPSPLGSSCHTGSFSGSNT